MLLWLLAGLAGLAVGQDRRPTISFITQPEIVTDIGGNVSYPSFFYEIVTDISGNVSCTTFFLWNSYRNWWKCKLSYIFYDIVTDIGLEFK